MAYRGRRSPQRSGPLPLVMLLVSAVALLLSLGSVLRTYAMPVEARTTEPWFGYQSTVGFKFRATVAKGRYYADTTVTPEQLLKVRGPVDPPTYRRVLISPLTDSVQVEIPYHFLGDRPADLRVKLRVDGQLVMPAFWQKPLVFVQEKEWNAHGVEIKGTETFQISIKQLLADMEATRDQLRISIEPMEIHIRPRFLVEVGGLKQALQIDNQPEFQMGLRMSTLEVDDERENKQDKLLTETRIVPITMTILGYPVHVSVLRQVSLTALFLFMALGIILLLMRRRKPDNRSLLQKLGTNLLSVKAFELPGDVAVAEVRSARELLQLQVQTERPVICVGSTYYLMDGTTCYRFTYSQIEERFDE